MRLLPETAIAPGKRREAEKTIALRINIKGKS